MSFHRFLCNDSKLVFGQGKKYLKLDAKNVMFGLSDKTIFVTWEK